MDPYQTKIYTAVLISSIVIGAVIIYFIISLLRHQRKNLELHKKNILAEMAALEKDRSRIAADLHDEIGPMLAAIKLNINGFELKQSEDLEQIVLTNQHIDVLIKRLREISFDLMPNSLIRKGLVMGLKDLISYTNNDPRVTVNFKHSDNFNIEQNMSINIYRIVQESIHNALKHAFATSINVSLRKEANKMILAVADDGRGFDHGSALKESSGFGLKSLLSRTQIMSGEMFIESNKGQGTTFTFEIPIP